LGSYFNLSIIFGANVNTLSQIVLFGLCQIVATSLLSFVLIERFIIERDNKVSRQQTELAKAKANEELQSETIRIKDAYQEELEANIQERTFELEIALRELQDKNRELEELNTQDALTGVRNRRYFDKKITMEYRRSRREQTLLSILMLDIDHFKNVNDSYGHLVGDEAIKFVADTIVQQLKRPSDIICRYGGEEFAVLLPNTDPPGALLVAEEIRQAICAKALNTSAGEIKITISCGVFSAIASAQIDPHQYTDNADKALYQAKQAGRNCVVLAENSYHHHEEA
jgi:diguanylate cyclase (GGDEF)-like protein